MITHMIMNIENRNTVYQPVERLNILFQICIYTYISKRQQNRLQYYKR